MCKSLTIEHYVVGIEDHRADGRVETVIRTIRDYMFKFGNKSLGEKVPLITVKYNETYHFEMKCSQNEVYRESRLDAVIMNSENEKYFKRLGTRK